MARRIDTEQYLVIARALHKEQYDYSRVIYTKSHDFIEIGCAEHGFFKQRAYCHIEKRKPQGCPKCSRNRPVTLEQVQARSEDRFGDKYKIIDFKSIKRPMILSCSSHGVFTISTAETHWMGKDGGCPHCASIKRMDGLKPGNISRSENAWLDELSVPLRQHQLVIEDRRLVVDGFDPITNTVYEYYGAYWHGNPFNFSRDDVNKTLNVTFGFLLDRTLAREDMLRKAGYKIVTKWEDCGKKPSTSIFVPL